MSDRLPDQTSHKAWASSAAVVALFLVARYTGLVGEPPAAEVYAALMVVLEGAIAGAAAFAGAWFARNRPKGGNIDAGAPEGGRLRSDIVASLGAMALLLLALSGCSGQLAEHVDTITGTTVDTRCAIYQGIIDDIEAARAADGVLTAADAGRLALYQGLKDTYCITAGGNIAPAPQSPLGGP